MIDGTKLTADYLRSLDGVPRVVNETPRNQATGWVRLTQLNAPSETNPEHLYRFMLQLDCYAGKDGGFPEAKALAATVREGMQLMRHEHFDSAVVTETKCIGDFHSQDTDFNPDRWRVALTFYVWAHGRVSS